MSVISSLVGFTVLGLVYGALRLWTEVPSAIFSNVLATVPSYYLNRKWTWGKTGRSHLRREVLPFWALSVGGILLSIVTATAARHIVLTHHLRHTVATVLVLAANSAAFGFLWVLKFLVFNQLFRVTRIGESSESPNAETLPN